MTTEESYEKGLAAGEAAASAAGPSAQSANGEKRMYVRTQGFGSTDEELRFLQRNGVRHKAARFPFHEGIGWKLQKSSNRSENATRHSA